jgi:hypothetical protein
MQLCPLPSLIPSRTPTLPPSPPLPRRWLNCLIADGALRVCMRYVDGYGVIITVWDPSGALLAGT